MEITSWIQSGALGIITTLAGWYKSSHDKEHLNLKEELEEKQDIIVCDVIVKSVDEKHKVFLDLIKEIKEDNKEVIKEMKEDQKKFVEETRIKFEDGTKVITELSTLIKNNGGIL